MKTFAVLVGVVAVAGFGFAQSLVVQPKVPVPIAQTQQAAAVQPRFAGGLVQTFPQPLSTGLPFGIPIHIAIGGTPMAGSYVAQECTVSGFEIVIIGGIKDRTLRAWQVTLESTTNPNANGGVYALRTLHADGTVIWTGGGAFGPSGQGAFAGKVWSPEVTLAAPFQLFGTDFNCSGGSNFVGNPAWGGGGNITLTVSP